MGPRFTMGSAEASGVQKGSRVGVQRGSREDPEGVEVSEVGWVRAGSGLGPGWVRAGSELGPEAEAVALRNCFRHRL